eukprot:COSAG01_NODE_8316_length_2833_cov_2.258595_1_plen_831_part_01
MPHEGGRGPSGESAPCRGGAAAWQSPTSPLWAAESSRLLAPLLVVAFNFCAGNGGALVTCDPGPRACAGVTCDGHGRCVIDYAPNSRCICECDSGYSGTNCEHSTVCDSSPCLHGGTCTPVGGQFTCKCVGDWNGDQCQNAPCSGTYQGKCGSHGTCIVNSNSGVCRCKGDWNGDQCQNAPCKGTQKNLCGSHGTCSKNGNTGTCTCYADWNGDQCQNDPCHGTHLSKCGSHGHCVVSGNSGLCNCDGDWNGALCLEDPCSGTHFNKCGNHGSCAVSGNSGLCNCDGDWNGALCLEDPCSGTYRNKCGSHGTCAVSGNSGNCTCAGEWKGDTCQYTPCETSSGSSKKRLCGGSHGTCSVSGSTHTCTCVGEWNGAACQHDPCSGKQQGRCLNGGTCVVSGNYGSCTCAGNYSGTECQCTPCETASPSGSSCSNAHVCGKNWQGACSVTAGTVVCNCTGEYGGDRCQCDPCNGQGACSGGNRGNCSGHGECATANKKAVTHTCACAGGGASWNGAECQYNPCSGSHAGMCGAHGSCSFLEGRASLGMCNCSNHYSGERCQNMPCILPQWPTLVERHMLPGGCSGNFLQHDQTCVPACNGDGQSPGGFYLDNRFNPWRCDNGTLRDKAGKPITPRSRESPQCVLCGKQLGKNEQKCDHGGRCASNAPTDKLPDGYLCNCTTGRSGLHCTVSDPCLVSLPCQNGAKCTHVTNISRGYECECPLGFSGVNCTALTTVWDTLCCKFSCDAGKPNDRLCSVFTVWTALFNIFVAVSAAAAYFWVYYRLTFTTSQPSDRRVYAAYACATVAACVLAIVLSHSPLDPGWVAVFMVTLLV